jgi:transaldolase
MKKKLKKLKIEIFADGADKKSMINLSKLKIIKGLTTNPSLMRKAGIKDYLKFSKEILTKIKSKSISLEIFADDEIEIERQARIISSLGKNVYVKIPIMNTKGKYLFSLIKKLSGEGIKLNVTAIFTIKQVKQLVKHLNPNTECYISIFAGRIADTGNDPSSVIVSTKKLIKNKKKFKIIWASTREVLNIFQADKLECHIITVGHDFIKKLENIDYNLEKYSLDTVNQFYIDAKKSNYKI